MIKYIIASILAVLTGQVMRHIIRRIPEIIERDDAIHLLIPTLRTGFKPDAICSIINLVLFNLLAYFNYTGFSTYLYMVVISALQVVFAIDFKMQLIPDTIQAFLGICGFINILYQIISVGIMKGIYYILGGIIGAGIFYILGLLGKTIFKKESMGFGDVKLMAGIGMIFGAKEVLIITLISFFISAVISILLIVLRVKSIDSYIPFGPFIVIASVAVMFTGYVVYFELFIALCTALSRCITDLMYKIMS